MNWQYLKYFEAVAETQHITQAAERLFITPSTLSRAISSLEEELSVPLFKRDGRNIVLTTYGTTFLEYVKQATKSIEDGSRKLAEMSGINSGTVQISTIYTYAATYLTKIIRTYNDSFPDVKFKVYQNTTMGTISSLLNGSVDIGLASDYIDKCRYSMLSFFKMMEEEIVLIVPENHPLASYSELPLEKISREKFISFDQSSGILYLIEHIFKKAGYHFNIGMMATDDYTIASLVRDGMGIAFIPYGKSVSKEGLHVIHMFVPGFIRNIYMIYNKEGNYSVASRQFIDYIKNHFGEGAG